MTVHMTDNFLHRACLREVGILFDARVNYKTWRAKKEDRAQVFVMWQPGNMRFWVKMTGASF